MNGVLFLVRGLPGSGKTSFASAIWNDYAVCEADKFFYDKEGNYDDIYRTWQINQPFKNMNGDINLPDDFSQMLANSPIIQKLGYSDPRITD